MKRTYLAGLLSITLGCSAVTGCGMKTEASMVHPKSGSGNAETELSVKSSSESERETSDALLRNTINAPEHIQSTIQNGSGRLRIITDADVEVPSVSSVNSIAVTEHPITQADVDRITDVFFPDAVFYTSESYHQLTKQEIQNKIDLMEQYLAEGNTDPYAYGWTEFDLRQSIENYKQWRDRSPEDKNLIEVPAQPGPEANGPVSDDEMYVVAVTPDGTAYDYTAMNFVGYKVLIEKIRTRNDMEIGRNWMEYQMMKGCGYTVPAEDELKQQIGLSLEDAKKITDEKISQLGLVDMKLSSWDYDLLLEDGTGGYTLSDTMEDAGYALHYTRTVNGIPVTYTGNVGGALDDMSSEMATWEYETLNFIITEDGIEQACIGNLYDLGQPQEKNLSLLPFSDIMNIFEKVMLIQNSFVDEYSAAREYHINRITLGYSRIYDPVTSSSSGTLIPVWDFFGGFTDIPDETEDGNSVRTNYTPTQSHLTINAMDGTVIDRSLGY